MQGAVVEQRCEQRAQAGVVNLAREVLEEAVELVEVAVGDGQECGRIGLALGGAIDRAQVDLQLVAKALDATGDAHEVTALEAPGQHIGVPKRAPLNRPRAVAQLDREVRRAGTRQQAVLARAREDTLDLLPGAQRGDGHGCDVSEQVADGIRP